MMDMIKVGRIDFLNILPIYHYLDQYLKQIQIVNQVPTTLNRMLKEGEIDVGPISAFSYAENADQYMIFPDLSISSRGKVRSIFLFSKKPITSLKHAKIALTSTSATSNNLLKIILEKYYGYRPQYSVMAPDLDAMLCEHDAALLIGDDAFVDIQIYQLDERKLYRYDLGELWNELTGYSMTFAVWAVRRDAIQRDRSGMRDVFQAFIASKQRGLQHLDTIIEEAERRYKKGYRFWEEYYRGLIYDLHSDIAAGLEAFFADAYECGFLQQPISIEVWEGANGEAGAFDGQGTSRNSLIGS